MSGLFIYIYIYVCVCVDVCKIECMYDVCMYVSGCRLLLPIGQALTLQTPLPPVFLSNKELKASLLRRQGRPVVMLLCSLPPA